MKTGKFRVIVTNRDDGRRWMNEEFTAASEGEARTLAEREFKRYHGFKRDSDFWMHCSPTGEPSPAHAR